MRHKTCERSQLLRDRYPVLSQAAAQISDPIVRNLGTVCGSVAHADPQGDWGSALLAAGAEVVARGPQGERTLPLSGFFQGRSRPRSTRRDRDRDPCARSGAALRGSYLKLERRVGDFATVAVGVQLSFDNGTVARAGVALTGVGATNIEAEEALTGATLDDEAIRGAAGSRRKRPSRRTISAASRYKRHVVASSPNRRCVHLPRRRGADGTGALPELRQRPARGARPACAGPAVRSRPVPALRRDRHPREARRARPGGRGAPGGRLAAPERPSAARRGTEHVRGRDDDGGAEGGAGGQAGRR